MKRKKIILICLGILLVAAIGMIFIFNTEPEAESEGAVKEGEVLVEVVEARQGNFNPVIIATGTVQPLEDIVLSPLVNGQVIRRSPAFTPGGFVEEGAVLLQIDPADYRNRLQLRKSELQQAETNLKVEMGRQEVAEQDLKLAGVDSLSGQQRALVLRKPQLEALRANVTAAIAAVDQAELDLSRTTIRAPFDAHILSQNVTRGSQIAPGDDLGRLVGSNSYWVILTVPVDKLQYLDFTANGDTKGSPARIRNTSAWPEGTYRDGYLDKQVGALDDRTRLARVLVRVPDPLARKKENSDLAELMIGAFVDVELEGLEVSDVIRLNRDFVRNDQTVWVMEEGKLKIREVVIDMTDSKYAYISNGLKDGEQVVVTNLSTVADGIPLRTQDQGSGSKTNGQTGSEE